jgi:hypothetical protein
MLSDRKLLLATLILYVFAPRQTPAAGMVGGKGLRTFGFTVGIYNY